MMEFRKIKPTGAAHWGAELVFRQKMKMIMIFVFLADRPSKL
jgi:hypothetical protein